MTMNKDEVVYRFTRGRGWVPFTSRTEHSTIITVRQDKYRVTLTQIFEAPAVGSRVWELTPGNGYRDRNGEPDFESLLTWLLHRSYGPDDWVDYDKWKDYKVIRPANTYVLVEYTKL